MLPCYFSPYMKYTRKIIHSVGSFFFFSLTKIANSFYSKINDCGRRRTTRFSSSRFGVRVTALPKIFTTPEISEILRGSPTKKFGTVRQKFFEGNLDTSPSLLSINFFVTRNFLKHSIEGFLYEMFRYCETKNFRRKILIVPPFSSINLFATGNFPKHSTEGFPYEVFRYCETKQF